MVVSYEKTGLHSVRRIHREEPIDFGSMPLVNRLIHSADLKLCTTSTELKIRGSLVQDWGRNQSVLFSMSIAILMG